MYTSSHFCKDIWSSLTLSLSLSLIHTHQHPFNYFFPCNILQNQIHQMDGFISVFPQSTLQLLPSSIENVEEEEDCTSLQTFPNQEFDAGTETIPFRNEQSGTATETKRMLQTWFKGFARVSLCLSLSLSLSLTHTHTQQSMQNTQ
jgi:hypothetical protein